MSGMNSSPCHWCTKTGTERSTWPSLGSLALNVWPLVDTKSVRGKDRLPVLMALVEAAEDGMLERGILNLNMFPMSAVARMTKKLKGRGFGSGSV